MSALYGAAGIRHDPELTRALLEAGANPNDGESRLPLDRGGEPGVPADPARARRADGRHERTRTRARRRAAGARPAAARARRRPERGLVVAHAVRRGRGPETIELLVSHGADVDRPGGETWRGDVPLRTPYQHAVLRGKDDVAQLLARARRLDRGRPGGRRGRLDRARRATDDAAPRDAGPRRAGGASSSRRSAGKLDLVLDVVGPRLPRCRLRLTGRDAAPPRRLDRLGAERRAAARARRRPGGACATSTRRSPGRRTARGTTTVRTATTLASRSGSSRPAPRSSRGSSSSRTGRSRSGFRAMSIASPNE